MLYCELETLENKDGTRKGSPHTRVEVLGEKSLTPASSPRSPHTRVEVLEAEGNGTERIYK